MRSARTVSLVAEVHQWLAQRAICADEAQQQAIQKLAQWFEDWSHSRRLGKSAHRDGLYLWGAVGRGKSLIMDAFYEVVPVPERRRVHFHAFLQELQQQLRALTGQADPLAEVARQLASQTRLLCFDEFHVHDIGDAMLLGRLLAHLQTHQVGLVMTSNYPPAGLCPNPLYRERFKPAIELLERRFHVLALDGGQDYRQQAGGPTWGDYYFPWNQSTHWVPLRLGLTPQAAQEVCLEINRHLLAVRAHEGQSLWVDFDALCRYPRASADFLWLCQQFSRIALDRVPPLDGEAIDVQQRFLNFIDIAYDQGIELLLVGASSLDKLLSDAGHLDFSRTRSRLSQLSLITTDSSAPQEVRTPSCSASSTLLPQSSY